jgi:glycosyltransferase involved in cell wall biosynthesis
MHNSSSIGLLHQGGKGWIAGVNYIHNLIRALRLLPSEERLPVHLILPHNEDAGLHREMRDVLQFYAYRPDDDRRVKLKRALESLSRGRRPASFEGLLARLRTKAIFPLQYSLGPHFSVPWIAWIPDFQHKHMPQLFSPQECEERDRRYARLIAEAPQVVVSSQEALTDLRRWFPAPLTTNNTLSVFTFPSVTAPEWYAGDPAATAGQFSLPEKFLMFPSQFWVHKNHRVVFEAIHILKKKGINIPLVCTGFNKDYRRPEHGDTLHKFIDDNDLRSQILVLGLLPRLVQIQLIRRAAAIMQPSLFEGWSFLVEDARSLGKKLYLSDIPIHREQHPPDAVYFSAGSSEQLADILARDWPGLSPGPDLGKESKARVENENQSRAFARNFLKIVDAAHRAWSPKGSAK